MEEKFLYHIWDAGHLLSPLKTVSGKNLQVNYQGQFNTDRGPDFRNVILNLEGEILRGDVEIHLNSYDWTAHEHHEDPHYNEVILHVVMNAGQQALTVKENGEAIEILELKGQLSDEIRRILEEPAPRPASDNSTYCELLSAVDNDTLQAILHTQGLARFRNKVRRFNASLLVSDFDQILYEGMMEALGYDKNKQNMLSLAQALPLKSIREWQREGMQAVELASVMLCSSGLLDRSGKLLGESLSGLLRDSFERQRYFSRKLEINWHLFRIRPASHPIYRILTMASLLHRTSGQGYLQYWLDQVLTGETRPKATFKAFGEMFAKAALPGAESLPQPGQGLVGNIYVNIFLPIASLFWQKHSDEQAHTRVQDLYAEHPPLQENHVTRYMGRYLSPGQAKLANSRSIYQQGLIEIFHRHCKYHLCAECLSAAKE